MIAADKLLETERLILEPLLPDHAPILFKDLQDVELYHFIPQNPPSHIQGFLDRFAVLSKIVSPNGLELWLNWAVRLKQSSQYVGLLQATILDDQSSLVAYVIFSEWQKKGLCNEGLQRVNEFLLDELKVSSILAEIDTRNSASIKVVEKLGFERIDTVIDADFFKGSFSTEYKYRLEKN